MGISPSIQLLRREFEIFLRDLRVLLGSALFSSSAPTTGRRRASSLRQRLRAMVNSQVENADRFGSNDARDRNAARNTSWATPSWSVPGGVRLADQCQQRPLVALHEAAERLDVCRQHPPDRIEVVVHGALPCCTELPLRGYTAGPGKSSPGLEGP